MNLPDADPTSDFVVPAVDESSGPGEAEDPRVTRAVEEYMAAVTAGRRPDRSAFLASHPEIAEELAECLEGLEFMQAVAPRIQRQALAAAPDAAVLDPSLANPLGDYQLVCELGRGGMGVVYEAVQLSLGRRVALKVLPFAAALDPRQMQRFRNEALAAAHLSHPHIVPVYAVGCERGVHYYAMQLVDGQSLAALITGLRPGQDTTPAPAPTTDTPPVAAAGLSTERSHRSPAFIRAAVRLAIQSAEALEHAHAMGVVHRDIKPANVLVDARGHSWITDFGLAQVRGGADLTLTGDMVGTLRYMSPEQARAKHDLVDHRADVYALGVTLYELLTLRPACDGHDRQEVLRQVLSDDPPRPRRLNPNIPADLETVLLTAMAKEPECRYPAAQILADDLRRVLDDQPIVARRPGLTTRLAKWGRRHRPAVGAAVVAALLGVVMLAVALKSVATERAKAARERDVARRAVDEMYIQVAEQWLEQEPEMEETQRQLVLRALAYYTEFAKSDATDTAGMQAAALAACRAGDIQRRMGPADKAEAAYNQAIQLYCRVALKEPGRSDIVAALAACHEGLGGLQLRSKRLSEAENNYWQAGAYRQEALRADPNSVEARCNLGVTVSELGKLLQMSGRYKDAEGRYRLAVELLDRPSEKTPRHAVYESQLGETLSRMAELPGAKSDPAQTRLLLERGLEHLRRSLMVRQRHPAPRFALASQLGRYAAAVARQGDMDAAEKAVRESLAMLDALARDFTKTPHYRAEQAATLTWLGGFLWTHDRQPEADKAYADALELRKQLVQVVTDNPSYARDLAWFLATCPSTKHHDDWLAVKVAEQAVKSAPDGGDCWRALGAALCRTARWRDAREALEKANGRRNGGDGREWLFLAMAHWHLGNKVEAQVQFANALKWLDDTATDDPALLALSAEVADLIGAVGGPVKKKWPAR
jgi:serine/threonine protein kinase/tetratricopeptide (TPR) repeat protein